MALYRQPSRLEMTRQHWEQMRGDAELKMPNEACGLLAGSANQGSYKATLVFPTVNILHSPVRYRLDPQEQLDVFIQLEERGLELVGIYHSHPMGPDEPSPTDISEAYYPESVYLIWSRYTGQWKSRGFLIQEGVVREVPVSVVEEG